MNDSTGPVRLMRRTGLAGLFLMAFTTTCLARQTGPPSTGSVPTADSLWTRDGIDWPGFLGPHRDGQSAETSLRFDWTTRPPRVVWTKRIGEGYGAGSVARGRFYHFDRIGDQARLTCLHAETGQPLWQFEYSTDYQDMYGFDGGPRSSPLIDDQRVYIFGVEGMLHCLNADTGDVIWKVDTSRRFGVIQNFFGVGSSPVIHNDLLIVMVGGSPPKSREIPPGQLDRVTANGTGIVAFDRMTGEVRYQTINDLASYSSPVIAEIEGQATGLALMRSGLCLFDPASGDSLWSFPFRARKLESVNASTPQVTTDGILITESYGPGGALLPRQRAKAEAIRPIWADQGKRDQVLACHWNTPVVIDGYAWGSSGEKMGTARLQCIRLADGALQWSEPGLSRCSLTAADGHVICLAETGKLLAFRPDPERMDVCGVVEPSALDLVAPCWAAPVVSHGYLYLRGKARIVCLDIRAE